MLDKVLKISIEDSNRFIVLGIDYGGIILTKTNDLKLNRFLRTRNLVVLGLILISPISVQTLFGGISQESQGHALLSYLVALVAILFSAYCYAKMVGVYPRAGSAYAFVAHGIHANLGFMVGWTILIDYILVSTLITSINAKFFLEVFPNFPFWIIVFILVFIVTALNYLGTKVSSRFHYIMLFFIIVSIVLFTIFSIKEIVTGSGLGGLFTLGGVYNVDTFSLNAVVSGSSIAILSYLGFDAVTTMVEDSKVPGKSVGRAVIVVCLLVAAIYVTQSYLMTILLPDFGSIVNSDTAFYELAVLVSGEMFATFTVAVVVITGIATVLAINEGASRVIYAMGRDKTLPGSLSRLHPKFKTPINAILLLGVINLFGAIFIGLESLFDVVAFGALVSFSFVNLSVIFEFYLKRNKRKGMNFILYLVAPLVGILVNLYILFSLSFLGKIIGICWIIIGLILLTIRTKGFKIETELTKHTEDAE